MECCVGRRLHVILWLWTAISTKPLLLCCHFGPCSRKHVHSVGCPVGVLVLLRLLLLSEPEEGGDGKSRGKPWPSAGRCGSSQLWDSLKFGWEALAGCLAALFSNRLFFPCCSFVVLFYKRNQRADYSSPLGERKGRPSPRSSLEVISDGFQMMVEGECAKKLNHTVSYQSLESSRILLSLT